LVEYSMELVRVNLNRLDVNLLVVLDALLDEQSITKAASRLHLSTSATGRRVLPHVATTNHAAAGRYSTVD
jgi:hypothetical protein